MKHVIIAWSVVAVLLLTNVGGVFYFLNEIETIESNVAINSIESTLEASTNSLTIYDFAKDQYEKEMINSRDYSEELGHLKTLHAELIRITEKQTNTKTVTNLTESTLKLLKARKDAFDNLKSAVDLKSDNFNVVAGQKFNEAIAIEQQIMISIVKYKEE